MSETIDKLIYALDGDLTAWKGKLAEAETDAQRSGKKISDGFSKPIKEGADRAAASSVAIQKALGGSSDAAAKHAKEIENLRVQYDRHFASQQKFAKAQQDIKMLVDAGMLSQRGAETALKDAAKAADDFAVHGTRAGGKVREGMVLVHEFMRGDWKRAVGSATIELQNFGVLGKAGIAAALLAIPAALALAAIQSETTFAKIQREIVATGYAAGVTRNQIIGMAQALDATSHLSLRGAEDTLTALAARGNVNRANLPGAARATSQFALASGLPLDKAADEMEKMLADPTKAAQQLQEQFKLLTVSEQEEIRALQARGEIDKAQAVLINSMNDSWNTLRESAWSLSKAWDTVSKGFSDFWNHTGSFFTGHGKTADQQVTDLRRQQFGLEVGLRQHGLPSGIAGARGLIAADPRNAGLGAGDYALGNIVKQYDTIQKQIDQINRTQTLESQKAKGGEFFKAQQEAVGAGLRLNKQYDDQGTHVRELTEQQESLNRALKMAIGPDVQFQDGIRKTRDAVHTALEAVKQYGDPAKEAALRAEEQAKINAARPENRGRISGEVEAARNLRQNLQDPRTAPFAQSIYQSQMKTADATDRFNHLEDQRAKNLRAMQEEANAAEAQARAFEHGAAAAAQAKIIGEANVALARKQISNEEAYAAALQKRAFWQERANVAASIEKNTLTNAGLAAEVAAGGNPFKLAAARRQAEAIQATAGEFNAAANPEQHMLAYKHYQTVLSQAAERDKANADIAAQGSLYNAQRGAAQQRQTAGAFFGGASDDDMRHLKVAQDAWDELIRDGIDPATNKDFPALLDQLIKTNTAASDLADAFQKAQQYAKELATGITSPLKRFLTGKESGMDALSDVGQNTADTLIQHQIIDPLQKQLESLFGNAIGLSADGTMSSPYYVIPLGPGGVPGLGGAPGAGGGMFGPGGIFGPSTGGGDITNSQGLPPGVMNMNGGGGGGGFFSGSGFLGRLFGGGASAGGAGGLGEAFGGGDFIGTASDTAGAAGAAAGGGDMLASLLNIGMMFAGFFDEGGTIGPGKWGIKSGIPEIIQGGTAGVSVMPVNAPSVTAALGSSIGNGARGSNNSGGGSTVYEGDEHHWHLPGVRDPQDFVRARSQLEGVASVAADRGKRNR